MQGTFHGCEEVELTFEIKTKEHVGMTAVFIKERESLYGQVSITGYNLVEKPVVKKPKNKIYPGPRNVLNGR